MNYTSRFPHEADLVIGELSKKISRSKPPAVSTKPLSSQRPPPHHLRTLSH
jgi:hypothetical protein